VRRFLPDLIELIWTRQIDPGQVFDLTLPLDQVAEGYAAMDERPRHQDPAAAVTMPRRIPARRRAVLAPLTILLATSCGGPDGGTSGAASPAPTDTARRSLTRSAGGE